MYVTSCFLVRAGSMRTCWFFCYGAHAPSTAATCALFSAKHLLLSVSLEGGQKRVVIYLRCFTRRRSWVGRYVGCCFLFCLCLEVWGLLCSFSFTQLGWTIVEGGRKRARNGKSTLTKIIKRSTAKEKSGCFILPRGDETCVSCVYVDAFTSLACVGESSWKHALILNKRFIFPVMDPIVFLESSGCTKAASPRRIAHEH